MRTNFRIFIQRKREMRFCWIDEGGFVYSLNMLHSTSSVTACAVPPSPQGEGKDTPAAARTTAAKERSVPAAAGSRSGARRTNKQSARGVTARPREAAGAKSTSSNDKNGAEEGVQRG